MRTAPGAASALGSAQRAPEDSPMSARCFERAQLAPDDAQISPGGRWRRDRRCGRQGRRQSTRQGRRCVRRREGRCVRRLASGEPGRGRAQRPALCAPFFHIREEPFWGSCPTPWLLVGHPPQHPSSDHLRSDPQYRFAPGRAGNGDIIAYDNRACFDIQLVNLGQGRRPAAMGNMDRDFEADPACLNREESREDTQMNRWRLSSLPFLLPYNKAILHLKNV